MRRAPSRAFGAALLALGLLWPGPVGAQDGPLCLPSARRLSGEWTTTETVDAENSSLWRGSLRLLQRGTQVVGRWEPPGGEPERLVAGRFEGGVLRLSQRGSPGLPVAGVAPAPGRTLLLTLSSDGAVLSGRWSEREGRGEEGGQSSRLAGRGGDLFASGQAGCGDTGGPAPGQPFSTPEDAGPAIPGSCARWDLNGVWEAGVEPDSGPPARLWLLQDGASLIGWYETGLTSVDPAPAAGSLPARLEDVAGAAATAPLWMVDGDVRGAVVRLTQYAGDGLRLPRTLVLDGTGERLSGPWPPGFGPPETEVLAGRATCAVAP
ncbi:MAG TPA: hypothetical protein VH257_16960 [Chloroflexota bacterium]|nr:hypothetical protein [Chloroflexota bacterium]